MSIPGTSSRRSGALPTPPTGRPLISYVSYADAQRAVDYLSDEHFPVQHVTIVGTDLQMVERVTGRLTYPRVAMAGAASGAWFGLMIGLLLSLFAGDGGGLATILSAVGFGVAFGMGFAVLSYAFTGGRRDFTSTSQVVASTYTILAAEDVADEALAMLYQIPAQDVDPAGQPPHQHGAHGGSHDPGHHELGHGTHQPPAPGMYDTHPHEVHPPSQGHPGGDVPVHGHDQQGTTGDQTSWHDAAPHQPASEQSFADVDPVREESTQQSPEAQPQGMTYGEAQDRMREERRRREADARATK